VLFEHPKVLEACVIGVPDEYRGETVKAFIVAKPGETIREKELDAFCREIIFFHPKTVRSSRTLSLP
jgi:long-chain acyl-CoA synthetase